MFTRVLIANRGEIAVRVATTLQRLGISVVALYSDADRDARHLDFADLATRLPGTAAAQTYLNIERIIEAAQRTGAEAIHPGYGFLAEHAGFARACAAAGCTFIGPSPEAIEIMGDKSRAKAAVSAVGVEVIAGSPRSARTDAELIDAAAAVGFPLLIKPAAGGGGKGMQRVDAPEQLPSALSAARRVAASAFGDDTLLLERLLEHPRHVEVQVLGDRSGEVVHLFERECSLQRRHQKVLEEAPAAFLDDTARAHLGALACSVAQAVSYEGVGTVEMLCEASAPDRFYFLEMNTRLQVEHPVTELITGVDLVEQQLRLASGELLHDTLPSRTRSGHGLEVRVYAEDPRRDFLPTGGLVRHLELPRGDGIRVDNGLRQGQVIGVDYDPMLFKLCAWGPDRPTALRRLAAALRETVVLGFPTNLELLAALVADLDVADGAIDTTFLDRRLESLVEPSIPSSLVALRGALAWADLTDASSPWTATPGFRPGRSSTPLRLELNGEGGPWSVVVRAVDAGLQVQVGETVHQVSLRHTGEGCSAVVDSVSGPVTSIADGEVTWLHFAGRTARLATHVPERRRGAEAGDEVLRSPMPGTVVAISAREGEVVHAGQLLVSVEAMKMEHAGRAPAAGVLRLRCQIGETVDLDQVLAVIEAAPTSEG